jgi:CRISPR-associated protein Csb2
MKLLTLRCAFVAHSYQGVRLTPEREEALDWPPAPGRVHQALMAAALTGEPPTRVEEVAASALDALQWLEQQPPPEIIATGLSDQPNSATRFKTAIPQNNPIKSNFAKRSVVLAEPLPLRAVSLSHSDLSATYVWKANDEATKHLLALKDLAAQLRYLGRSEDRIEASIDLAEDGSQNDPGVRWRPTCTYPDIELPVAKQGTTADLIRNLRNPIPARTRRSPASRFLRIQSYSRDVAEARLPVFVGILQVFSEAADPDEPPLSCDAENASIFRSTIRETAIELARDSQRWDHPELAIELISGHLPGQTRPTEKPHLAFVPLPSINPQGSADGRIRRVALLGYAPDNLRTESVDIYRALLDSLDGEPVMLGATPCRLRMLDRHLQRDKVWAQFTRFSRVWHSVTPAALAGGFKVPKYLADGKTEIPAHQRSIRRLAELAALLRSNLRHLGLPEDLIQACDVTLTPSPLLPNTSRAESYRPPGEKAVFTHVRLEFAAPVRGPLIVGDRRYQGFGLLYPA